MGGVNEGVPGFIWQSRGGTSYKTVGNHRPAEVRVGVFGWYVRIGIYSSLLETRQRTVMENPSEQCMQTYEAATGHLKLNLSEAPLSADTSCLWLDFPLFSLPVSASFSLQPPPFLLISLSPPHTSGSKPTLTSAQRALPNVQENVVLCLHWRGHYGATISATSSEAQGVDKRLTY